MLVIRNAVVISPKAGLGDKKDIYINTVSGEIAGIADPGSPKMPNEQTIDAEGLVLMPGFIDLHVHLREPGFPEKETIYTGTRAMAKGGFTTVCCMPNTRPALDSVDTIEGLKKTIEKDAVIDVLPIGAITIGIEGSQLSDHDALMTTGIVGISDDGRTTMNNDYMVEAYRSSARLGIPVMTHSEDHDITDKLGGASSPREAEDNIVIRDIDLLGEGHLHICHVSTVGAIEAIRKAQKEGKKVTGEATPHHFGLDLTMIDPNDPYSKVNPPIRTPEDRKAVIEALRDGTLCAVATDHAPHEKESKEREFNKATMGISGAETAFMVAHTELVLGSGFSLAQLAELMCEKPADVIGLEDRGVIEVGKMADLVLIDPEKETTVDPETFVSKGKNTPFAGRKYKGAVAYTFKKGRQVYADR